MKDSRATPRVVVLGSGSPRRREILDSLKVPHLVLAVPVDEDLLAGEAADAYLERIVRAKLAAVERALPAELRARASAILVADTSVIVPDDGRGERVLGKPADASEACAMIERLAGRTHEVHTRFALASVHGATSDVRRALLHEETVRTRVTFRPLAHARAVAYAETGEGLDKAGGYAVQGMGAALVSRIEGSYSNVVGLPACEVSIALERLAQLGDR